MIFQKKKARKPPSLLSNRLAEEVKRVERCTECRHFATRLTEVEVMEEVRTLGFNPVKSRIVKGSARLCVDCVDAARKKGNEKVVPHPFIPW